MQFNIALSNLECDETQSVALFPDGVTWVRVLGRGVAYAMVVLFLLLCACNNWHRRIHILRLAFDRNSLVASYRLVFFSDALHLSLRTSRTHHHCSLGRCHPHTVVLSHTRTHSSSLSHASVATNCTVLNHLIGSIIGFTLLLGLEIEMF